MVFALDIAVSKCACICIKISGVLRWRFRRSSFLNIELHLLVVKKHELYRGSGAKILPAWQGPGGSTNESRLPLR